MSIERRRRSGNETKGGRMRTRATKVRWRHPYCRSRVGPTTTGTAPMNRPAVAALFSSILIAATAPGFAQNARAPQPIASSDVLSQISIFAYTEGKKSSLNFRGTPIAANALGKANVEYDDGNAEIAA